jgi:NADPH2:quinone reductase
LLKSCQINEFRDAIIVYNKNWYNHLIILKKEVLKQMKGVVVSRFGGPEVLEYRELEMPVFSSTQVLVRVEATSVNFADTQARQGKYHGAGNPPFVPGLDLTGTVEAVGADVKHLHPGQRVIAFPLTGSYAEYVVTDQALTFAIPDSIDTDTAAACPIISFTSFNLLSQVTRLQPGESVLVHAAAGGIGTTAIQLAKRLGAKTVIGTVGSDAKKEIALQAGADHVINYQQENFAEQVNHLTQGHGVDVILDSVAGETFDLGLTCLARFGRIAAFGMASGRPGQGRTNDLHASCRSVLGYSFGTNRKFRPESIVHTAEQVIPYLASGQVKMFIGGKFTFAEVGKAHELIQNRAITGKIIVTP